MAVLQWGQNQQSYSNDNTLTAILVAFPEHYYFKFWHYLQTLQLVLDISK